jgi:hypothetical protein
MSVSAVERGFSVDAAGFSVSDMVEVGREFHKFKEDGLVRVNHWSNPKLHDSEDLPN